MPLTKMMKRELDSIVAMSKPVKPAMLKPAIAKPSRLAPEVKANLDSIIAMNRPKPQPQYRPTMSQPVLPQPAMTEPSRLNPEVKANLDSIIAMSKPKSQPRYQPTMITPALPRTLKSQSIPYQSTMSGPALSKPSRLTPDTKAQLDRIIAQCRPAKPTKPLPPPVSHLPQSGESVSFKPWQAQVNTQISPVQAPFKAAPKGNPLPPAADMKALEFILRSNLVSVEEFLNGLESALRMEATNELQQAYKAGESGSAAGFLRQSTLGTVEDIWDNFHLTDFTQDPHPFLNKAYPIVSDQTYIGRDDRQTDMTDAMRKGANIPGNAWKLGATAMDAAKESIPAAAVGEIWKNILANAVTNAIAEQSGISREEAQQQAIQWLVSNNYLSDLVDLEKQQADLALAAQNQGWGARATANLSGLFSRLALPILVGKYFSPAAGRAMLAASVGGQTWQEAIGAGATPDQARQAGLPTMLKSYIIESLAGGLPYIGKGVLPQPLSKPGRYITGALGEAGECFADGLFQDYINKGTWNSDAQWTSEEELAQEALRDFLISLLLQGAEGVALSGKSKKANKQKNQAQSAITKMHQREEVFSIPKEKQGNFDDFTPLALGDVEKQALNNLHALSKESSYEYCVFISKGATGETFTSELADKVYFDTANIPPGTSIFHSHTNVTPFSGYDFHFLLDERIDKIGCIAYNGDVFVASVGNGWRPSREEFDIMLPILSEMADENIQNFPDYYKWSTEERKYMAVREQAYIIARYFGWTLAGGNIYE